MIRKDTHQFECVYEGIEYILEEVWISELGYVMYTLRDPVKKIWLNVNTGVFWKNTDIKLREIEV
jgi:hypothetical protein